MIVAFKIMGIIKITQITVQTFFNKIQSFHHDFQ